MNDIKKIFITGGCGFIGSHLSEYFFKKYQKSEIVIFDKMTYAAHISNLSKIIKNKRVHLIKKDICNLKLLTKYTRNVDLLIHAAAESHVDKSYILSDKFIETNVKGTKNVMEVCLINKIKNIIHISTDEVYGEIHRGKFQESNALSPTNPYSSSKAAAEMIVAGYKKSYKLPVKILRPNNIFGIRQHPEKLISGCIWCVLKKKKFTMHGDGNQKRTFLHVEDFCNAVDIVFRKGKENEIYNVGTNDEYKNKDVIKLICKVSNNNFNDLILKVPDRLFNDARYSIDYTKLKKLGWKPKNNLIKRLKDIFYWMQKNHHNFKR